MPTPNDTIALPGIHPTLHKDVINGHVPEIFERAIYIIPKSQYPIRLLSLTHRCVSGSLDLDIRINNVSVGGDVVGNVEDEFVFADLTDLAVGDELTFVPSDVVGAQDFVFSLSYQRLDEVQ